ncbi:MULTISPECIES: hypothetical protein [unclassified Crossiella]|uniref:hypothetical protein n=1 Tax=unclassified Crossiella TaxID=2620835 RepID=UPI001FFEC2C0|nr:MULTISPECIES: hypothetical protein [unclassified Crossiella]MCK2237055.1 hypothetical protein [Crossiella sp. S99.2]MCK2250723.1 hypothetical protein [Crossiella sp. S99.1]
MTRNSAERGTVPPHQFAEALVSVLRATLPNSWLVTTEPDSRHDFTVRGLAPDGTTAVFAVQVKNRIEPRDVSRIAAAARDRRSGALVMASPFVSPMTRRRLAEEGIGWFDLMGNLRLMIDRPSVFIDRQGADRGPERDPADRRLKSLRGAGSARVVLDLCAEALPIGVRELAERAEVGPATSARVLELLAREAVLDRGAQGQVTAVRKQALIRRWIQDYGLTRSNALSAVIDPRGIGNVLDKLRESRQRYVITGSAAAHAYLPSGVVPVAPLMTLVVYAENPAVLMRAASLRETSRGANMLLGSPFDDLVYARSRTVDGLAYADPAQVVADLLTGPGRAPEEAEQLLATLAAEDASWAA